MAGANDVGMRLLGRRRTSGHQDRKTVRVLRLGVGVIGALLPIALIAGNWIAGDAVIVPSSMSGSYYTSTRNLFVGSLCALGVFLIGYRHTERQDRCTWFAGICAVLVAFCPTAPSRPQTEPAWVNYLHHAAAGALIFTLGLFCLVVFTDYARPDQEPAASVAFHIRAWLTYAWSSLTHGTRDSINLVCGLLVFVSGALAVYTGLWPTSWSTGWSSLYLFEAVAVFSFGVAWTTAAVMGVSTMTEEQVREPEPQPVG